MLNNKNTSIWSNKKAQDLSIGTLILIVLGIIVLVLLVLGFTMGWGNLWDKINIFGGGSSLGDIVTACNLPSISEQSYCYEFNKVKVGGQVEYVSCQDDRIKSQITAERTCDEANVKTAKENKCRSLNKNDATQVGQQSCATILSNAPPQRKCVENQGSLRVGKCSDLGNTEENKALCRNSGCTLNEGTGVCSGSPKDCTKLSERECLAYSIYCSLEPAVQ